MNVAVRQARDCRAEATISRELKGATMEAITYGRYGSVDALAAGRAPIPALGPDAVLVRVHAAALHVGDCFAARGVPFPVRFETGLFRPNPGIPGFDFAGQVEAVGRRMTRFRPGDAVFGIGKGTCAEYTIAEQQRIAAKPVNLTFEQAAAIPTSALAALHGLRDAAQLRPRQSCLINGASGGVGTFAIQIAKLLGAEVTAVCSTANVQLVRSLGADHVIDYTREDFTVMGTQYDVIFDNVENRSLADCRRALKPHGTLILNSGTGAEGWAFMARLLKPLVLSPFVQQNLRRYLSSANPMDLNLLKDKIEAGKLLPVVDRVFPLAETADALRYIDTGHTRGKVVVKIPHVSTLVRPFARS
jgi:NADPH:quinone reductase-like Zn-dependent oxidoreductase